MGYTLSPASQAYMCSTQLSYAGKLISFKKLGSPTRIAVYRKSNNHPNIEGYGGLGFVCRLRIERSSAEHYRL